jgi:hypothetical protein
MQLAPILSHGIGIVYPGFLVRSDLLKYGTINATAAAMAANGTQEKEPKKIFFKEIARPGKMSVGAPAVFTSKLACPHDRPKRRPPEQLARLFYIIRRTQTAAHL